MLCDAARHIGFNQTRKVSAMENTVLLRNQVGNPVLSVTSDGRLALDMGEAQVLVNNLLSDEILITGNHVRPVYPMKRVKA